MSYGWSEGNYGKAEELYLRALEGNEAQLGKDHEVTKQCSMNLAVCLAEAGEKLKLSKIIDEFPHILIEVPDIKVQPAKGDFVQGDYVKSIYGHGIVDEVRSDGTVCFVLDNWFLANNSRVKCYLNPTALVATYPYPSNRFGIILGLPSAPEYPNPELLEPSFAKLTAKFGVRIISEPTCILDFDSRSDATKWCDQMAGTYPDSAQICRHTDNPTARGPPERGSGDILIRCNTMLYHIIFYVWEGKLEWVEGQGWVTRNMREEAEDTLRNNFMRNYGLL